MKRMICILLILVMSLSFILIPASAADNDIISCIISNPEMLTVIYEQLHPDSDISFAGSSVEYTIPVVILPNGALGTYLDFNGDNGYMVITDGNDVLKWEAKGDLSYLKSLDSTYFSNADGFGYYIDDQFIPYVTNAINEDFPIVSTRYLGQSYSGEGGITYCADYIIDRYTSEYEVDSFNWLIGNFWYMNQGHYSIYDMINSDGSISGEGNCSLSSVYALLNYLKTSNKCPNFPSLSEKVNYYAGNDSFYSKYSNNTGYRINSPKELPVLYKIVRDYAIDDYNYERDGFNSVYHAALIEKVAQHYQESVNATLNTLGGFEACIRDEIDASNPVLFTVDFSETYGSHAMVVTGYRVYVKTTTILGIDFKDYVYLLEVNDNWTANATYFDFTAFDGTHSFVTVEVN